jgi:hypothetical protein
MLQIEDVKERSFDLPEQTGKTEAEEEVEKRQLAVALVQQAITTARNNISRDTNKLASALQTDDEFDDDFFSENGSLANVISAASGSIDLNGRFFFDYIK